MLTREDLYKKFERYSTIGKKETPNGSILFGHPLEEKKGLWLAKLFSTVNINAVNLLEEKIIIPNFYKHFLLSVANGFNLFVGVFALDGYRVNYIRDEINILQQPFDLLLPNVDERPKNATEFMFFFGGYCEDGSLVYVNTETNKIYRCEQFDVTPLYVWDNFDIFLETEIDRICSLYDDFGNKIDPDKSTLPI